MSVLHDEVEIEDMDFDEEEEIYYYPCPCGDRFEIAKVRRLALFFFTRDHCRKSWKWVRISLDALAAHSSFGLSTIR